MKNKLFIKQIKPAGIILTSAVIFCSLLLVFGCADPFDSNNFSFASGSGNVGTVRLYIAGTEPQGRTIMPVEADNNIVWYRLQFGSTLDINRRSSELNNPIELDAGSYELTVSAYTSDFETEIGRPAAKVTMPITIIAGQSINETISLTPEKIVSGGSGKFSWDIKYNISGLTGIEMVIQDLSGNAIGEKKTFNTGAARDINEEVLPSGYYRVVFTLERSASRPVIWRETLHVYQSMTSHFDFTFTEAHFIKASYTVTYNYNYDRTPSVNSYFLDEDYRYKIANEPADPVRSYWRFGGWYTNANWQLGTVVPFNLPLPQLSDDITVYARWIGISQLSTDLTQIALSMTQGRTPASRTVTIRNFAQATANATNIQISLSGTDSGKFNLNHDSFPVITPGAGGNVSFTVTAASGLANGTYNAMIIISYAEDEGTPLQIPVTLSVTPRFSHNVSVNTPFNSNNLIEADGVRQGWYTRNITGSWLVNGIMISGEERVIDIPMTSQVFTHSNFNNGSWNYIPASGWTSLTGGIGRFQIAIFRDQNQSVTGTRSLFGNVNVEVFIPNNGVVVWFDRVGTTPPNPPSTNADFQFVYMDGDFSPKNVMIGEHQRLRPAPSWYGTTNPGTFPLTPLNILGRSVPRQGFFMFPVGNNLSLFIRIDASASYTYTEEIIDEYQLPYPILQGNDSIYYWKEGAEDHWSVSGEDVRILEFTPGAHNASGSVKVRAYDPSGVGVVFEDAVGGLDTWYPAINKDLHYRSITTNIDIDDEVVGTMTINITDHVLANNIVNRVELSVTYSLEAEFFDVYLDTITCEGIDIPKSSFTFDGTRYNATLELSNQFIHGPLTMHTNFTFVAQ
ncbi:MAG: InlB B-repeat-containing protein [Treponema sp.]|nr:InlB B-repeat-containing protein [Treponema sp.]